MYSIFFVLFSADCFYLEKHYTIGESVTIRPCVTCTCTKVRICHVYCL